MENTKYCLCCGEDVPFNSVERFERRELTCLYCGFVLDVKELWQPPGTSEGYALIAEDSQNIREMISGVLEDRKFSAKVAAYENGLELISAYSKLLAAQAAVDVAIIDLNMPIMDGMTAARTMRALEVQHGILPVPIVFFSAMKADDALRVQMELLRPASYMNKGSHPDTGRLAERVEMLVGQLMKEYRK
ncbi:MAG TPA: response regulator [Thermodesulfovibrionales bacterium]|nr:response regulator [Thermodesulfovibrionales bacterium]